MFSKMKEGQPSRSTEKRPLFTGGHGQPDSSSPRVSHAVPERLFPPPRDVMGRAAVPASVQLERAASKLAADTLAASNQRGDDRSVRGVEPDQPTEDQQTMQRLRELMRARDEGRIDSFSFDRPFTEREGEFIDQILFEEHRQVDVWLRRLERRWYKALLGKLEFTRRRKAAGRYPSAWRASSPLRPSAPPYAGQHG